MPPNPEIIAAFDAALRAVERAVARQMRTRTGEPARAALEQLRAELVTERQAAMGTGAANRDAVGRLVRDVDAWAPEGEMELIAALGRIARASE